MNQQPTPKTEKPLLAFKKFTNLRYQKQKNKETNKQPHTHDSPYHFCLCCDPNKGFKFFFFLNQCNAVGTMQRKCTQKTETGARLCPGRTSEAGLTERWLACVGTCIPCTILPPRPLGGSTISLHLQFVQHLRDETKHTKVRNCRTKLGSLVPGTSVQRQGQGLSHTYSANVILDPRSTDKELRGELGYTVSEQAAGVEMEPCLSTSRDKQSARGQKHKITGCGHWKCRKMHPAL